MDIRITLIDFEDENFAVYFTDSRHFFRTIIHGTRNKFSFNSRCEIFDRKANLKYAVQFADKELRINEDELKKSDSELKFM